MIVIHKTCTRNNLRSSGSKDFVPFRFCAKTQCNRERHCKQKDDKNLDMSVLLRVEQRNDRRHQQNNGQESDDEAREDVYALLGIQPHELI